MLREWGFSIGRSEHIMGMPVPSRPLVPEPEALIKLNGYVITVRKGLERYGWIVNCYGPHSRNYQDSAPTKEEALEEAIAQTELFIAEDVKRLMSMKMGLP